MPREQAAIFISKSTVFLEVGNAVGATFCAILLVRLMTVGGGELAKAAILFIPFFLVTIGLVVLAVIYCHGAVRRLHWLCKGLPLMNIEASGFSYVVDLRKTRRIRYEDISALTLDRNPIPHDVPQLTLIVTKLSGEIEKIKLNDLAIKADQLLSDLQARI